MASVAAVIVFCALIHLVAIAVTGKALGVAVREFCFGLGPTIARRNDFCFRLIPLGGSVRFLDSRLESVEPAKQHTAFDQRSASTKVAISLSGCIVLLLVGAACTGSELPRVFVDAVYSLLSGALQPLTKAQTYLQGIVKFANSASFPKLLGAVAVTFAALNLLPFPSTNGGAAIAAIASGIGLDRLWSVRATKALALLQVALFASWSVALLLHFAWR